jgi:hypothetical protein
MRARQKVIILLSILAVGLSSAAGADETPCAGDANGDRRVTINELVTAVNHALNGCPEVEATPTRTPCPLVFTCTCANGCGDCGVGGDLGDVRENVPCESANDICAYKDGPCDNPNLPGCDGTRVFEHGWTCVANP